MRFFKRAVLTSLRPFSQAQDLHLITENKIDQLIKETRNITKWEASAVSWANGAYYVVFDNLHGMLLWFFRARLPHYCASAARRVCAANVAGQNRYSCCK